MEAASYSAEEVAKHNSQDDAWMIIDGKVYDVTNFSLMHPGGEDVLFEAAGRDATREFEEVNHSTLAKDQLKTLLVGTLRLSPSLEQSEEEKQTKIEHSLFPQLYEWFEAHTGTIRQIASVSATVLFAAYIARRYAFLKTKTA